MSVISIKLTLATFTWTLWQQNSTDINRLCCNEGATSWKPISSFTTQWYIRQGGSTSLCIMECLYHLSKQTVYCTMYSHLPHFYPNHFPQSWFLPHNISRIYILLYHWNTAFYHFPQFPFLLLFQTFKLCNLSLRTSLSLLLEQLSMLCPSCLHTCHYSPQHYSYMSHWVDHFSWYCLRHLFIPSAHISLASPTNVFPKHLITCYTDAILKMSIKFGVPNKPIKTLTLNRFLISSFRKRIFSGPICVICWKLNMLITVCDTQKTVCWLGIGQQWQPVISYTWLCSGIRHIATAPIMGGAPAARKATL